MHTIIAAVIDGRRYELNKRCTHPFLDRMGGAVVTSIDTSSANGCSPVVEVRFDDRTKVTTALTNVILCWQDQDEPAPAPAPAVPTAVSTPTPKAGPKRKKTPERKATAKRAAK